MQAKSVVRSLLDSLPDDVSWEAILYNVYALVKIEEGEQDIREGSAVPHEQVMRELFARWARDDDYESS